MSGLRQHLRSALRSARARFGLTLLAVLTITIGVGGTTAMFSVVNALLIRPLPFEEPDELVTLDVMGTRGYGISLSVPNFLDWRERNRVFDSMGSGAGWSMTLTDRGPASEIEGMVVLGDFFETLGLEAVEGRVIASQHTTIGADPVAVVSHTFRERYLAGTPALGENLVLDGDSYTVIGVLPPHLGFPTQETEVYVPMGALAERLPWEDRDSAFGARAVARLSDGVTIEAAQADMDRVTSEIRQLEGKDVAVASVLGLDDYYLGFLRPRLWILMGAVGLVLLIATTNVTHLLLARGEGRREEMAVRSALGASRKALVGQLLVESLLLSVIAGVAVIGVAYFLVPLLLRTLPDSVPLLVEDIRVDRTVLVFTLAITGLVGVGCGLLPALRTSRSGLAGQLRELRAGRRSRLRSALVSVEMALAVVLLIGAGLTLRSLTELGRVDKGFDAQNVLTARVGFPRQRYDSPEKWLAVHRTLLDRVKALPGVGQAAWTLLVPLTERSWENGVLPEGVPFDFDVADSVLYGIVTPGYFETLGVPLLQGRTFGSEDHNDSEPVVIVDETLAERYWPGEDPLGKRLAFEVTETEDGTETPIYRTIVGVAKNVRHYELRNPSRIQLYVPLEQTLTRWGMSLNIALRTEVPPTTLYEPLRAELAELDTDVPLSRVETLEGYVDRRLSDARSLGGLLSTFAGTALLLAGIGLFGVMSFAVLERRREIGIRMAVGATRREVLGAVSAEAVRLSLVGIAAGLVASFLLTRLLEGLLFEVSPLEPSVFVAVPLVLLAAGLVAAVVPALRASRVDPVSVLRQDG